MKLSKRESIIPEHGHIGFFFQPCKTLQKTIGGEISFYTYNQGVNILNRN